MEAYQTIQLKTGTIIQDRYRIEQVLGSGGSAITYRATQLDTRRNVTVKQFVQYEERFEQEVAILRQFSYLEGVVSIVDAFHENTIFYIVMQYVEGITLAQYIKDNGAMHAEDVIPLFLPIMKSLGLLHKQGMIHRDISPDNFIIDFQNHLWLIDFGAAGVSSNRRQQMKETASDQTVIVKAGYTPLEQYRKDGKIGSHTDVYALCATMYTAFTGHTLPDAITRIQKNDITPITTIPEWQWKALSKGLSVNLQDRYLNMGELIDGLTVAPVANIPVTVYPDQITDYTRQILEHNTGEEVIMNYFDQESRQSGRHRIILLIILVFLVGISVSMVYYIRHNSYNGSSRQQTEQPYTSDIYTEAVSKDVSTQDKSIRNEEAHITTEAATETVTTQVPSTQIQSTTTESSTKKEYQIKESSDYDEFQLGD